MNLWLRLLCYVLTMWRRGPLIPPYDRSSLRFRVWPTDLDIVGHVNNGRYLTLMDFGRLDLMVRSGLWRTIRKQGWFPTVVAINVRYRREMRLGTKFRLDTRIVSWTERTAIMEHSIWIESGPKAGQLATIALVDAGIYDPGNKRYVTPDELLGLLGSEIGEPPGVPDLDGVVAGYDALRSLGQLRQDQAGSGRSTPSQS